jgi:hypothetical protein
VKFSDTDPAIGLFAIVVSRVFGPELLGSWEKAMAVATERRLMYRGNLKFYQTQIGFIGVWGRTFCVGKDDRKDMRLK